MKLNPIQAAAIIIAAAAIASCTKDNTSDEPARKSNVSISFYPEATKAADVTSTTGETAISSLEVFAFRVTDGPDNGILDSRKSADANEITARTVNMEITTGRKNIYIFANSAPLSGISRESDLAGVISTMSSNTRSNFAMIGTPGATVNISSGANPNTIRVRLQRLACRIKVENIKTAFTSSAFRSKPLTLKGIHLIYVPSRFTPVRGGVSDIFGTPANAHGYTSYHDFGSPDTFVNTAGPTSITISPDTRDLTSKSYTSRNLTDTPFNAGLYLYSYPNTTSNPDLTTKLILETEMDGITWYYPIPIAFTQPNTAYTINNITITRPGSTDPNTPIVTTGCTFNIEVLPWEQGNINGYDGNENNFTI